MDDYLSKPIDSAALYAIVEGTGDGLTTAPEPSGLLHDPVGGSAGRTGR
jgi:hypothetical protein